MAQQPLKINPAGTLSKSINENQPDFQPDIQYTDSTVNVTSGIVEGIGPRYGFSPIPGQMDQEAPASGACAGFMASETSTIGFAPGNSGTGDPGFVQRVGLYGIYPISLGGPSTSLSSTQLNTVSTYYIAVLSYTIVDVDVGEYFIDALLLSVPGDLDGVYPFAQSPDIFAGLPQPGYRYAENFTQGLDVQYISGNSAEGPGDFLNKFQSVPSPVDLPFVSAAPFSISGSEQPMQWLIGAADGTGSADRAPNLRVSTFHTTGSALDLYISGGVPPSFNYGNFPINNRSAAVYCLYLYGNSSMDYTVAFTPTTSIYTPLYFDNDPYGTTVQVFLEDTPAIKTTSSTTYTNNKIVLYNDPVLTCNSSYQGIMIACGSAKMVIYQDWYNGGGGNLPQYVDLANLPILPQNFVGGYTENGSQTPCCFVNWPAFVPGTPMAAANGVALGAAGSGLLRATTIYEFTYSVYDKRLNYETNVGSPVQIQTGSDDFVSLILFTNTAFSDIDTIVSAYVANSGQNVISVPWPGLVVSGGTVPTSTTNINHINYLQYRFYYRQQGMQTWLPALQVDAPQWWYYPGWLPLAACTGAIGGTPGGDPGDFQDYSPLPQGNWTCTLVYKNRAFWFSEKQLNFSLINNFLAYPARNSSACPSGSFKGALVQAYYGQANQNARLVVFSTDGTYVGIFTGQQQVVSLTLDTASPPTVAQFPLDGSDFELNAWTSVTAFSYRSAVVAEGLLYFWGPQGVFLDDGVDPIQRISVPIEPLIFGVYDTSDTDAIFCEYNDTTKEIWWFYPPLYEDATNPTHGICYNKLKNTWLFGEFAGQVDSAQALHVDTGIPTAGTRLLAISRQSPSSTIQRAYFFDQNNLAADIYPGKELMVKSFTSPTTSTRQLTLAAGHSTGTISAGDLIALQQCPEYTNGALTSPADFIAQVTAVGTGTVTIAVPAGVTFDASATIASNSQFFPIYHAQAAQGIITGPGINAFPYVLDTKFWTPNGMSYWGMWIFVHLVYKLYDLLPVTVPLMQIISYQTPVSGEALSDYLTLINNSSNNCQILHPLGIGQMAMEGQGIKLTFSGYQLASSWVLQFIEAYSSYMDGPQLKIFEG